MAKSISQAMFDDVVRENMEEFDMDAETAVAEAVEQFEAQVGIHLTLVRIFKDKCLIKRSSWQAVEQSDSLRYMYNHKSAFLFQTPWF